jgi:hypothetical protein
VSAIAKGGKRKAAVLIGKSACKRSSCRQAHLHKLHRLECQLAKHVGVAAKQHMPEVVHLSCASHHIRQLSIIHKPAGRSMACSEV